VTAGLGVADLVRLGAAAERAARLGGRVVAEHFANVAQGQLTAGIVSKAPGDYVSEVDVRSEETIREALERDAPGIVFFGEEGGGVRADLGWVVDPLDGTANFLHGFPVVGVSVALVEGGRPVAGAVHAPMLGDTYTAVRGGGAFRDGHPLRVADRPAGSAICATGFPFKIKHRLADYRRVFEGAFLGLEDLRRAGAASLDLAWTAAGVFDGFFEIGLGAWDVAAGALLVTEAGGMVTDWAGDDRAWLASGDILAAPAPVHRVLLDLARGTSSGP
jgi:myo-inositol-1(or 4)-monophosphatase